MALLVRFIGIVFMRVTISFQFTANGGVRAARHTGYLGEIITTRITIGDQFSFICANMAIGHYGILTV
jgi:hypothetical protein